MRGCAGLARDLQDLLVRQMPEVRFVVRFVDDLSVLQTARVATHRFGHDPLVLGQNPLVGPGADPFGRGTTGHVAVAETLWCEVATPTPFERSIHASVVDAGGGRLFGTPGVPTRSGEVEAFANARFVCGAEMVISGDHAAEQKIFAGLRKANDAIASSGEREPLASVQTCGECGVRRCCIVDWLSCVLDVFLSLGVDHCPFTPSERFHVTNSP